MKLPGEDISESEHKIHLLRYILQANISTPSSRFYVFAVSYDLPVAPVMNIRGNFNPIVFNPPGSEYICNK